MRPLATGASPLDSVGAYEVLFRGYDPLDIVKWGAYHLADLDFYLAVVPVAVAPTVLWILWGRARDGSRQAGSFVAVFLTVNAGMLFVTAAFSSIRLTDALFTPGVLSSARWTRTEHDAHVMPATGSVKVSMADLLIRA